MKNNPDRRDKRLSSIGFVFPKTTFDSREFFDYLSRLLVALPNADKNSEELITVRSINPVDALPVTTFAQADVSFPEIHFDDDPGLRLSMGSLRVNPAYTANGPVSEAPVNPNGLSMKDVYEKLNGHIIRFDHAGLNLPTSAVSSERWAKFVARIAAKTNVYKYPTGEPWLFILPATETEFRTDIAEFVVGREPRFELVHDAYSDVPTIQIDLETDLTRDEVESLFPTPYGISFSGLADYFRSVYLRHTWPGLAIRLDIRFKNDNPAGEWETSAWLVKEGGRAT